MVQVRLAGACRALYCFDVARGIDLARAAEAAPSSSATVFQHKSGLTGRTSLSTPLRLTWAVESVQVGGTATAPEVEVAVYDFGALCVTWRLPVDGPPEQLVRLSAALYDNAELARASRRLAGEVAEAIVGALDRPLLRDELEDYVVFTLAPTPAVATELLQGARQELARILRAEAGRLSEQEVEDALADPVSYAAGDLCLVDWLAAILVGADTEDERRVLELATVELFELRLLDATLAREMESAYALLAGRRGAWARLSLRRRELERLARIEADSALLHEGTDNALKLFGDDYLARLYRTAGKRFHFDDWDGSIQRKLGVLHAVNESLTGLAAHGRSEVLEWLIIALIAVEIVLYFTPFH